MSDLLIKASPGVGKTYSAIEGAGQLARQNKILFTTQTQNNVQELSDMAQELVPAKTEIRTIRGRTGGKQTREKGLADDANCYNIEEVNKAAAAGYSPGLVCCPVCQHNKICPYKVQLQKLPKKGIIFATHESASTLPFKPNIWIIDESPIHAFLRTRTVSPDAFLNIQSRLPSASASTIESFQHAARKTLHELNNFSDRHVARIYATKPVAEWHGNSTLWNEVGIQRQGNKLSKDLSIFDRYDDESQVQYQQRLYNREKINLLALSWLLIATGEERGVAYIQINKDSHNPIAFVSVHNKVPKYVLN